MIEIVFRNGEVAHYKPDEYTEYRLCGRLFVVIYEKQWIGIYNLDDIVSVEIGTVEDAEKGNSDYTYIGHLKEKEDVIRVGDEVEYECGGEKIRFIVTGVKDSTAYGFRQLMEYDDVTDVGEYCDVEDLRKTGRHFDEVAELLKKMKENKS